MMYHQVAIKAAHDEREREVRRGVRQRRLVQGEGTDPDLAIAAATARSLRRERRIHSLRLATP